MANRLVSVNDNLDFPEAVQARQAERLADSGTPEGAALAGAFASTSLFDRKRVPRPHTTVISNLAEGHGWNFTQATATVNLNDTTDRALGDRAVTVSTAGDGHLFNNVRLTNQALDMTDKGLILWIKVVGANNLRGWFIDIGDNSFNSYFRCRPLEPSVGKSPIVEGEWCPLWIPFSAFNYNKVGTPTKSTVTAIRMWFGDSGSGQKVTLKVGGLATYTEGSPSYPNGVATFTFDDTSEAQATVGAPALAKYGFTGTLFPILDRVGQPGGYSLQQLRFMVDVLGFELGAHATNTANHTSVVGRPRAELEAQFRAIRQWGFDNNFPPIMSYAYPVGPFDQEAVHAVRRYFNYGRTNDGKVMSLTSQHRYSASAYVLGSSLTLAAAKTLVDNAVADKTWITFVIHGLTTSTPGGNDWRQADYLELVDYCAASGIAVAAAGDVIDHA